MYPWHGNPHPHSNPHSSTASTTSTQYQMSHLRWHPSMMSRSQHHQNAISLPTMSSNLRMAQNSNHQPVSVVVESRQPTTAATTAVGDESDEGSDGESDHSDSGMGTSRDMVVLDAPGDTEYVEMENGTGNGRRNGGSSAGGLAITATSDDRDLVDGDGDDLDTALNPTTHNHNNQTLSRGGGGGGDARKHGKRLTTKEEVSLFDICNHHADEFGQRSNLCKWWNTVTDEFTRDQGHPYSWHSVRRKVEMVTKQRMKFLEEQRDKGGNAGEDLSNPRWRAAVDAWIPTWQRWEEAEAKRIEKRDSRKTRKRKSRAWEYSWETASDAWRAPSSPVGAAALPTASIPTASLPAVTAPAPTTTAVSTSQNSVPVRLPPGFDSMFSNPNPSPPTPQTQKTTPYSSYHPTPPAPTPPETSSPAATATATESMTTALLQTLGKLNKHLDAAAPDPHSSSSSPFISALVSTGQAQPQPQAQHSTEETNAMTITPTSLSMLKEELRREMQDELRREIEKDRASLEEKLDSVQRTQEMILEMLRQEPA